LEHLLLSLLDNTLTHDALLACGANINRLRNHLTDFINQAIVKKKQKEVVASLELQRVIQRAAIRAKSTGQKIVSGIHVLMSMFSESESQSIIFLSQENVSWQGLNSYLINRGIKFNTQEDENHFTNAEEELNEVNPNSPLALYTTNLNNRTRKGLIDP